MRYFADDSHRNFLVTGDELDRDQAVEDARVLIENEAANWQGLDSQRFIRRCLLALEVGDPFHVHRYREPEDCIEQLGNHTTGLVFLGPYKYRRCYACGIVTEPPH